MSDRGIKVSLPGYDVKTATPEQCALHSDYASPKVRLNQNPAHFNTFTINWTSDPGIGEIELLSIPHGYSYRPACVCFVKGIIGSNVYFEPLPSGTPAAIYEAFTTNTHFKIVWRNFFGYDPTGESYEFKYYIFAESGA
jgi:hypothetical protein